jgi:hypothetical protein
MPGIRDFAAGEIRLTVLSIPSVIETADRERGEGGSATTDQGRSIVRVDRLADGIRGRS